MANDAGGTLKAPGTSEQSCCVEFEQVVNDLDTLLRRLEACSAEPQGSHNSRLQLLELRSAILELDLFNRKLEDLCEDLLQTKYGLEQMTDTASAELRQNQPAKSESEPLAGRHHKLLIDESVRVQGSIARLREEICAAQCSMLSTLRQTSVRVFNMAAAVSVSNSSRRASHEEASAKAEQTAQDTPGSIVLPPENEFGPVVSSFIS